MIPRTVMIRGAGDLATGVAHRLWHSGFDIVMLEKAEPLVVRRTVSFADAVYNNQITVESVRAELCLSPENVSRYVARKIIPVVIDPVGDTISLFKPSIIVDAIMAKANKITRINDAELVIGLGPGFTAAGDVDVVIETQRGLSLGKTIYTGSAAEDTAEPAEICGYGKERVLRAPGEGTIKPIRGIGESVKAGERVASVDEIPVYAPFDGLIRGMLYPGLKVTTGMKIGDIDPRGDSVDFRSISDKARAIGGGVLEAIMHRYFFMA